MFSTPTMERAFSTNGENALENALEQALEFSFSRLITGDRPDLQSKEFESWSPIWLSEIENRLRGFSELGENWDSYGAKPIDEKIVKQAFQTLLNSDLNKIKKPRAVPRKDGGINFEWDFDNCFLSIEIRNDGNYYFFFDKEKDAPDEGRFEEDNIDSIYKKIR